MTRLMMSIWCFSSAGASVSREFIPTAVEKECLVIDNTSAFRMDADTPLVIPEVNMQAAMRHQGLIANPNCSTIQMLVALKPLYDEAGVKRIVVFDLSECFREKVARLSSNWLIKQRLHWKAVQSHATNFHIRWRLTFAFDWPFADNGYSEEEIKMVKETQKNP